MVRIYGPRSRTNHRRTTIFLLGAVSICFFSFVVIQVIVIPLILSLVNADDDGSVAGQSTTFDSSNRFPSTSSNLRRSHNNTTSSGPFSSTTKRRHDVPKQIDGHFNGAPLTLRSFSSEDNADGHFSTAHCIGDNYMPDAWLGRSCHFRFFCFNTTSHRYTIFQSKKEKNLRRFLDDHYLMRVSSTMTYSQEAGPVRYPTVSLGGVNLKWGDKGIARLEWFPDVHEYKPNQNNFQYYELPASAVLVPFHSMNGANPGHLVWDDFMSIYNLLHMFDLKDYELLLMRFVLQDDERGLWASCDFTDEKTKNCKHMINKFLPIMVGMDKAAFQWSTTQDFDFVPRRPGLSDLLCAKHGVAGLGSLTDHGFRKTHGWVPEDYNFTYNYGRGGLFRDFRNFVINNLELPSDPVPQTGPHRIVFSVNSSDIPARVEDFQEQMELVQQHVPSAKVEYYEFKRLSLRDQIEIASQAAVFITVCGGGAVTGMFLPAGSSVILFYHERGGVRGGRHSSIEPTNTPAMLDWDFYNSVTHLRVHWMPKTRMSEVDEQMAFVSLVRYELQLIESRAF